MRYVFLLLANLLIANAALGAERACVLPDRGHFRVLVASSGVFGVFGHGHVIEARKIEGCASIDLKDVSQSSIKLIFSTRDLRAVDPKESPEDRAKVQKTMEEEVLTVAAYPQVTFESTAVQRADGASSVRVQGNLTIRGSTHPVVIPLTVTRLEDGVYRAAGEYSFEQTTFGIKPIQLMGGTVKVKNELRTEFEMFLK